MYRRTTRRWASSRSPRFGARRGRGLRIPSRPARWQRANFFVDNSLTVANTSDSCFNSAILIARHANLNDPSTQLGRSAINLVRWIEIGGIVYDWGFRRESLYDQGTGSGLGVTQGMTLCSDRLDQSGAPVTAATVQWHRPQSPIATATATSAAAENTDFPTQIHLRKWERKPHYAVSVNNPGELLLAPEGQYLDTRNPTINRRLRIRLDPNQGLFIVFSIVTGPSYAAGGALGWPFWLQGQLYYRVRES